MRLFNRTREGVAQHGPARTVTLTKDPAGSPAVNLDKVRDSGHVDLAKRASKAGISLSKRDLAGIRAQAVLVLDHSGSMRADYQSGAVQTLVERVLGFALQIDVDGVVPVIPFDTYPKPTVNVGVTPEWGIEDYRGVVDKIWRPGGMGTTNLADALDVVRSMAETTDAPMFVAVVTDGCPDSRTAATDTVVGLSRYPVFLKFIAIREVPYLRKLDTMDNGRRLVDNANAKFFPQLDAITDMGFAEAMVDEWDTWIAAATAAGILR